MTSLLANPLEQFNGTERRAGFSYELSGDRFGLDMALPDRLDVDENAMSATIIFADGNRRDGVGDLLEIGGIRLDRHRSNPVVLFDHGKKVELPIALACERSGDKYERDKYTVTLDEIGKVAALKAFFYQGKGMAGVDRGREFDHALFCEQLFHMLATGLLRGGSIGYQVIRAEQLPQDYRTGTPQGLHLIETLMLEGSLVVMPANQDTVRKALCNGRVCGKPISPWLKKSLEPYTEALANKTVVGFQTKAEKETFTDFDRWNERIRRIGGTTDGQNGKHGDHTAYDKNDQVIGEWDGNINSNGGWIQTKMISGSVGTKGGIRIAGSEPSEPGDREFVVTWSNKNGKYGQSRVFAENEETVRSEMLKKRNVAKIDSIKEEKALRAKSRREYEANEKARREAITENRSRRMRSPPQESISVPEKLSPPLIPVAYRDGTYEGVINSDDVEVFKENGYTVKWEEQKSLSQTKSIDSAAREVLRRIKDGQNWRDALEETLRNGNLKGQEEAVRAKVSELDSEGLLKSMKMLSVEQIDREPREPGDGGNNSHGWRSNWNGPGWYWVDDGGIVPGGGPWRSQEEAREKGPDMERKSVKSLHRLDQLRNLYENGTSLANYQKISRLINRFGGGTKINLDVTGNDDVDQPALTDALDRLERDGKSLPSGSKAHVGERVRVTGGECKGAWGKVVGFGQRDGWVKVALELGGECEVPQSQVSYKNSDEVEKEEKGIPRFKPGDKVRFGSGETGTVEDAVGDHGEPFYQVRLDAGGIHQFTESELERKMLMKTSDAVQQLFSQGMSIEQIAAALEIPPKKVHDLLFGTQKPHQRDDGHGDENKSLKKLRKLYGRKRTKGLKINGHDFVPTNSRIAGFQIYKCSKCDLEAVKDSRGLVATYDDRGGVNNQRTTDNVPCDDGEWPQPRQTKSPHNKFIEEKECWRCGKEGDEFKEPAHPDGGGTICDTCYQRMFGDEKSLSGKRTKSLTSNPYNDQTQPEKYADWNEGFKDGRAGVQNVSESAEYQEGNEAASDRTKSWTKGGLPLAPDEVRKVLESEGIQAERIFPQSDGGLLVRPARGKYQMTLDALDHAFRRVTSMGSEILVSDKALPVVQPGKPKEEEPQVKVRGSIPCEACGRPFDPMNSHSRMHCEDDEAVCPSCIDKAYESGESNQRQTFKTRTENYMWGMGQRAMRDDYKNLGTKSLSVLRKLYRPTKGVRRRLRKSVAGSASMWVDRKDLEKVEEEARSKGVKFSHDGGRDGMAKVRLSGDDGAIDGIAKCFGKRGSKAMNSDMERRIIRALERTVDYIASDAAEIGVTRHSELVEMAADANRMAQFDKEADAAFYKLSTSEQEALMAKVKSFGTKAKTSLPKIRSLSELRNNKNDPLWAKWICVASSNLGGPDSNVEQCYRWLEMNAMETDEAGVVAEVNFVRDMVKSLGNVRTKAIGEIFVSPKRSPEFRRRVQSLGGKIVGERDHGIGLASTEVFKIELPEQDDLNDLAQEFGTKSLENKHMSATRTKSWESSLAALTENVKRKVQELKRDQVTGMSRGNLRQIVSTRGIDVPPGRFDDLLDEAIELAGASSFFYKSLEKNMTKTKSLPGEAAEAQPSTERLGAQVLRRLHEDHKLLLKDYHEMMGPLEHEPTRNLLEKKLKQIAEDLDEYEGHFGKHYKDLPALAGDDDEEGMESEEKDLDPDEEGDVTDGGIEEKDGDEIATERDDLTVEAGSGGKLPEPTPEEVAEGMEVDPKEARGEKNLKGKKVKALKEDDEDEKKEKALCPACKKEGKESCSCKRIKAVDDGITDEIEQESTDKVTDGGVFEKNADELEEHEKAWVKEASEFLDEVSGPDSKLDEEGRMKAYHHHKALEGIGQVEEMAEEDEKELALGGSYNCPHCNYRVDGADIDAFRDGRLTECPECGVELTKTEIKSVSGSPEWEAEEAAEPEHQKAMTRDGIAYWGNDLKVGDSVIGQTSPNGDYLHGRVVGFDSDSDDVYIEEEGTGKRRKLGGVSVEKKSFTKSFKRKACKAASRFFKELSGAVDFGDPHREKAKAVKASLEPVAKEDDGLEDENKRRERTGVVCSNCGSDVSEEEKSSGESNCCHADVVDESQYGKAIDVCQACDGSGHGRNGEDCPACGGSAVSKDLDEETGEVEPGQMGEKSLDAIFKEIEQRQKELDKKLAAVGC